jgi:uncharacterized protein
MGVCAEGGGEVAGRGVISKEVAPFLVRKANVKIHGVDFTPAAEFARQSAVVEVDDREDYRELRELALGFIGVRLHMLVFTRRGDNIRIISLRKAEKQEVRDHAKKIPG